MSRTRIRDLNDAFRRSFSGGRIMLTEGVAGLPAADQATVLETVSTFADFTSDNDPHGSTILARSSTPASATSGRSTPTTWRSRAISPTPAIPL